MIQKDIVLFINAVQAPTYAALRSYQQQTGRHLTPVVLVDEQIRQSIHSLNDQHHLLGNATVVTADFTSMASLRKALEPYRERIAAVTSQYENSIPELKKLIPYLPQVSLPTETSLDWATDKKLMREAFNAYDKTLSPASIQVHDDSSATIAAVERAMSYPVIIKPSGLERSLLVSVAHDRQELTQALTHTYAQLHRAYKTWMKRLEPTVLVEELMQGDMYSIDSYVGADGSCRHAPPIRVVTGRAVGFDDFFAYLQLSPAGLTDSDIAAANDAAERACAALGLRSITAHTELMRTAGGWKIIEVGPRIGGYRYELYSLSHGMNHIVNDILNRAGEAPVIPAAPQQYAGIFKTYAREEGTLDTIIGLEQVRALPSFIALKTPYKTGDQLRFASNNGDAVIEVTLCHRDEQQLQTDIKTLEQTLRIQVTATADSTVTAHG